MSLVHLPPGYHLLVDQFRQWCTKTIRGRGVTTDPDFVSRSP